MLSGKKLYLSILNRLDQGDNPSKISKDLNIKKQKLQYYLSTLKREGCIEKIGYGTWKKLKDYAPKEVQKTVVIGQNSRGGLKEEVRGHGFMFNLNLPKGLKNWDKREKILSNLKIKFDNYYVGGIKRGQRITAQKIKVALTNNSIIVNFPESYIRETATLCKKDAVAKFLRVIKHLERMLRANFSQFGKYKFRVSRQHYSLMKNSLARQYLAEEYTKKKLHVYSGRGLWLLIDNSYNLEELETVHKDTAVKDNEKVQDFFNGLDMVEGFTPQFVLKAIAKNTANLNYHGENMSTHVKLMQNIDKNLSKQTALFEKQTELIEYSLRDKPKSTT